MKTLFSPLQKKTIYNLRQSPIYIVRGDHNINHDIFSFADFSRLPNSINICLTDIMKIKNKFNLFGGYDTGVGAGSEVFSML